MNKILTTLLFFTALLFEPARAFAPSPHPEVIYDEKPLRKWYTNRDGIGVYETSDKACESYIGCSGPSSKPTFCTFAGKAVNNPNFGWGCDLYQVDYVNSGANPKPDWVYRQHAFMWSSSCPENYQTLDKIKGPEGFGHEWGTTYCGMGIPIFVSAQLPPQDKKCSDNCLTSPKVGDPIDPSTGNVTEVEIDYSPSFLGGKFLSVKRFYNSIGENAGWSHWGRPLVQNPSEPKIVSFSSNVLSAACGRWHEVVADAPEYLKFTYSRFDYSKNACLIMRDSSVLTELKVVRKGLKAYLVLNSKKLSRSDGSFIVAVNYGNRWEHDASEKGKLVELDSGFAFTTPDDITEFYNLDGLLQRITLGGLKPQVQHP